MLLVAYSASIGLVPLLAQRRQIFQIRIRSVDTVETCPFCFLRFLFILITINVLRFSKKEVRTFLRYIVIPGIHFVLYNRPLIGFSIAFVSCYWAPKSVTYDQIFPVAVITMRPVTEGVTRVR